MSNKPEPDSDSINMFIGQLPRQFNEEALENFLLQYGPIYEIKIMREKESGASKGCGFVTFYSRNDALKAQMALHNLKIFPGMSNPVQMKPADLQRNTVEQRRLFVGMLGKMMTEEEVSALFFPYGTVDECTLMKDTDSNLHTTYNKGYGFVIMSTKTEAENAVNNLNDSITLQDAKGPLVVKIAFTNRDKEKKTNQNNINNNHFHNEGHSFAKLPRYEQINSNNNGIGNGLLNLPKLDNNYNPCNLVPSNQAELQQLLIAAVTTSPLLQTNPIGMAVLIGSLGIGQNFNSNQGNSQNFNLTGMGQSQMNLCLPFMQNNSNSNNQFNISQINHVGTKGPEGCNLVVHKLPKECCNDKLYQLFSPFGNIVSANVFYDKNTGLSKCYGFVSYDNKLSAQTAIQEMNNFQIKNTRLKVSFKSERPKPY